MFNAPFAQALQDMVGDLGAHAEPPGVTAVPPESPGRVRENLRVFDARTEGQANVSASDRRHVRGSGENPPRVCLSALGALPR
ncbi:hypothetical protein GCM10010094_40060 [Streptomyces flaveus]|uniref:Uncharacterized protein n=1 Tax=Streptomyces flaveus TaxID=66370 RepID=A0A917VGF6_9ACTN|nr:hypothetical protein GCM10010094_40060 [Streptomyces flaveus]